jgi:hypothetical protein
MSNFFELWELALNQAPGLKLHVCYGSITDWSIQIDSRESSEPIYYEQSISYDLAFAKAYVWLEDYLGEKYGGY